MMDWLRTLMNGRHKRTIYLIASGALGVLLLLAAWWPSNQNNAVIPVLPNRSADKGSTSTELTQLHAYELSLAHELEQILSQITGLGGIKVMLKVEAGTQLDLAQNVVENQKTTHEGDPQGGTRVITELNKTSQVVFTRESGAQGEQPMVVREMSPKVAGVVVVAQGAERPEAKAIIISAVQTVLNVGAHKVQVYAKK